MKKAPRKHDIRIQIRPKLTTIKTRREPPTRLSTIIKYKRNVFSTSFCIIRFIVTLTHAIIRFTLAIRIRTKLTLFVRSNCIYVLNQVRFLQIKVNIWDPLNRVRWCCDGWWWWWPKENLSAALSRKNANRTTKQNNKRTYQKCQLRIRF